MAHELAFTSVLYKLVHLSLYVITEQMTYFQKSLLQSTIKIVVKAEGQSTELT